MTLIFPVIFDDLGFIKLEHREYFNRTLPALVIDEIIYLLNERDYQTAIHVGAVRKIIFHDKSSISRFFNALVCTNHPDLFKYFVKKLSYDDRFQGLLSIDRPVQNPDLRMQLIKLITNYLEEGVYVGEIQKFLANHCFN